MFDISISGSGLDSFCQDTQSAYSFILAYAKDAYKAASDCLSFVLDSQNKLKKQQIDVEKIAESADSKYRDYSASYDDAKNDLERYKSLYDFEDESSWYLIFIEAAQERMNEYKSKLIDLDGIINQIQDEQEKLGQLASAMSEVKSILQDNLYTIDKCINVLQEEITYNLNTLKLLFDSVQSFLASKEICEHMRLSAPKSFSNGFENSENVAASRRTNTPTHKYRIKGTETIGEYLAKHHEPIIGYRWMDPHLKPIRQQIFQATKWMGYPFQHFILRELENVVILNGRMNFSYGIQNNEGKVLRIIGTDINDPAFSQALFYHLSHNLYIAENKRDRVAFECAVKKEARNTSFGSDVRIQQLTSKILSPVQTSRRKKVIPVTAGSKFFASCFNAYVHNDREFLSAVGASYPDSYRSFIETVQKITATT